MKDKVYYDLTRISLKIRNDGWYILKSNKARPSHVRMNKEEAKDKAIQMSKKEKNFVFVFDEDSRQVSDVFNYMGNKLTTSNEIMSCKHYMTSVKPL